MTKRIPQPRSELPASVRLHEARLLAVMLRTSRLTWVFGEPGTDKSALLQSGVLPLLQRRRGDRGAQPAGANEPPKATPERRRCQPRPISEVAIYFGDWAPAPLSALKRRIADAAPGFETEGSTLAGLLHKLHRQRGLGFVFLLDRFEDYLAQAPDEAEVGQFADELIEAIGLETMAASFLIALEEGARPRLERFRARIPGFDHDVLRLSPVSAQREPVPPPAEAAKRAAAHAAPPHKPTPRAPITVDDVYALIESRLRRQNADAEPAPWRCDLELDLQASVATPQEHRRTKAGRADQDPATGAPIAPDPTGATARRKAR